MAAVDRLYSWIALMFLSAIILIALVDQLPPSKRNGKGDFVIATSAISLSVAALFVAGNLVDSLRRKIVGNIVENGKS
jgi:ABC-type lipoprotein release transport system permease subunit